MIRKIGILILIGIISMYTVIPTALADDNDNQNINDEITIEDEEGNIFKIIWDKLTSMLTFSEDEEEETTVNVEEEHPSGKTSHGAIVSIIARLINKLESVVGKTHGLIMRAIAKTNWGKKIEENDSSDDVDDNEDDGLDEDDDLDIEGERPIDIPSKVLEPVFDHILDLFDMQKGILEKVKEKVPDEAKPAIERAIDNNERKTDRMVEIKEHVLERVRNRNSNNE